MGTRKAPAGARHAACRHHEAYASAPAGWLCFATASVPTDDELLGRMVWADEIASARDAYHAAYVESLGLPSTGIGYGTTRDADTRWLAAATPRAYSADLIDKRNGESIAEPVSFADYTGEAVAA